MTAEYFDQWFTDIARSDARQQLFTEHLGLPPEISPSDMVPLAGLREVAATLALSTGAELVDLACGRGGPGMWIARETGAELIGIDFSAEAINQAAARRSLFGLTDTATFAVGTIENTGLPSGSADAVVCIDSIQFASSQVGAAAEIRRILRAGGRVVLTCWEPADASEATAHAVGERVRFVALAASLRAAGFVQVNVQERAAWHETTRRLWTAAVAVDPAGDPALESMRSEGERSLAAHDSFRRVIATAVAP
jgi:SAM-dependent methyltransferase